jgi:hypothetical protein
VQKRRPHQTRVWPDSLDALPLPQCGFTRCGIRCRRPLCARQSAASPGSAACTATALRLSPSIAASFGAAASIPPAPRAHHSRPSVCATRAQPVVSRVFGARLLWLVDVTGVTGQVVRSGNYRPKEAPSNPFLEKSGTYQRRQVCAGNGLTSATPTPDVFALSLHAPAQRVP